MDPSCGRFESLIAADLGSAGFTVVPPLESEAIWKRLTDTADIQSQIDCGVGHMMVGPAVGAVVCALVGSAMPSWEQRLPTAKASSQSQNEVSIP